MKTDTQLKQDLLVRPKGEFLINGAQSEVEVKDGSVPPASHANSLLETWNIEMDVRPPVSAIQSDAEIAYVIENSLGVIPFLPNASIKVMVKNGWVNLSGAVDWEYQRQATKAAIHNLMGISGVSNNITLKSQAASK